MSHQTFPEIINTPRLLLRQYRDDDADAIFALVQRNRALLTRDFEQQASWQSLAEAHSFIADKQSRWRDGSEFCYGIWTSPSPELAGQIRIKNIDPKIPAAELSYFIDERFQRQGFAQESVREVLRTAFEKVGFRRIFIRVLPANRASLSLAQKLGFQNEGLHRQAFRCGFGELHDVHYLSILAEDWKAARRSS